MQTVVHVVLGIICVCATACEDHVLPDGAVPFREQRVLDQTIGMGVLIEGHVLPQSDGQRHHVGHWTHRYDNGALAVEGCYDLQGRRTGEWRYFYPDGQLHRAVPYTDGKVHGTVREYARGSDREIARSNFRAGVPHGETLLLDEAGQLVVREEYVDGVKIKTTDAVPVDAAPQQPSTADRPAAGAALAPSKWAEAIDKDPNLRAELIALQDALLAQAAAGDLAAFIALGDGDGALDDRAIDRMVALAVPDGVDADAFQAARLSALTSLGHPPARVEIERRFRSAEYGHQLHAIDTLVQAGDAWAETILVSGLDEPNRQRLIDGSADWEASLSRFDIACAEALTRMRPEIPVQGPIDAAAVEQVREWFRRARSP